MPDNTLSNSSNKKIDATAASVQAEKTFLSSIPWLAYGITLLVIVFDQMTKISVSRAFEYAQVEAITSFFNLTLRHNYGVAFSIFDDAAGSQRWWLSALAIIVSIVLVIWIARLGRRWTFELLGLSLILGGAIGNVYDRVTLGYVVDFIEVHYSGYHWPAFNIADSAICIGAGMLLVDAFFFAKKRELDKTAD